MNCNIGTESNASQYYASYEGAKKALAKPAHYLELYNKYFADLTDKTLSILELGIFDGHSLEYFSKMFPMSKVFGVDRDECARTYSTDRIKAYQGSQDDPALFKRIMTENGVQQFDIIIDDCSHIGSLTLASFNILYPLLTPGGIYVIEDWGAGYYRRWPGGRGISLKNHLKTSRFLPKWFGNISSMLVKPLFGRSAASYASFFSEYFKSHQYGIPGVMKQLVDEIGIADATHDYGIGTHQASKLNYLHIYHGIVFMQKPF